MSAERIDPSAVRDEYYENGPRAPMGRWALAAMLALYASGACLVVMAAGGYFHLLPPRVLGNLFVGTLAGPVAWIACSRLALLHDQ